MTKEEVLKLIEPIKIVKILSVEKHPNADRLVITQVDLGSGEPRQVITGAPNVEVGQLVPFLDQGNVIPGYKIMNNEEIVLSPRDLRGIESTCMILAEDEIGLSKDHEGLMMISGDDSLIGKPITEILSEEQINKIVNGGKVEVSEDIQEKIDLIKSIAMDGGEIVGEDQLPEILMSGDPLYTYDGFEPSGQMHIAQGIIRAINTNKMIKAGFTFRMWVADWFGFLNNKMGGDLDKIKKVGEYFIEIWRASGMDLDNTEFLWTSDFVSQSEYWEMVMKVSRVTTLKRMLRTTEIMGRKETDDLSAAQILYPAMQITDIFKVMKCQVTQLGLDQRKVNMLAREVGPALGFWKPVIVSHRMLRGLGKPVDASGDATERAIAAKMSKSIPDSAIFMTDTREDIERKIIKAYCVEGDIKDNPILEYCKYIIFEAHHLKGFENFLSEGFQVKRDAQFGGDIVFKSFEELEKSFEEKTLFPLDLKNAVIEYLDQLLQPVRNHFESDERAKNLLAEIQSFQVTR